MSKSDGGPAFPQPMRVGGDWVHDFGLGGMSLRDYAAIHAQFSRQDWERVEAAPLHEQDEVEAAIRYGKADAMLRERERNGNG